MMETPLIPFLLFYPAAVGHRMVSRIGSSSLKLVFKIGIVLETKLLMVACWLMMVMVVGDCHFSQKLKYRIPVFLILDILCLILYFIFSFLYFVLLGF